MIAPLKKAHRGRVYSTSFTHWQESINAVLDATQLAETVSHHNTILIKPNLVEVYPPPITVPPELVHCLINYLKERCPGKNIIIGEGTGSKEYDTFHCFSALGYESLALETGVELIDLNKQESQKLSNPDCKRWPVMYLPKMLDDVFLLSVPMLKAHSLAGVTLTMKNMMGCPPPEHYQQGGFWKKASFHHDIHPAIFNLNRYRTPDFTLLDATIGMAEAHLWGAHCNPPINKIVAGYDPVAIDAYGCTLLGKDWRKIGHITLANQVLGDCNEIELCEV